MEKSILNLSDMVNSLPQTEKDLFKRIFEVSMLEGSLVPTEEMYGFIKNTFGSIEAVKTQRMVKITNLVTYEGSSFNELRSKRPMDTKEAGDLEEVIKKGKKCLFCNAATQTPADVWGRTKGKFCITASNIAKYDQFHGLIVFNDHNPFVFEKEKISDYIDTSLEWFKCANEVDKDAIYPFLMWNCLWRAGASIIHGHMQTVLSQTSYSKLEGLRKTTENYEREYGSDYWEDLFKVHSALDLTIVNRTAKIIGYLTPVKEKEILILADGINEDLKDSIYKVLKCYYDLGVRSFNLVISMPPLREVRGWERFPILVRILDRGDPANKTVDVGAMELYANSIVSSDPFKVIEKLKEY